jgi:hypothetical protein
VNTVHVTLTVQDVAVERIRASAADAGYLQMRDALQSAGAEITALFEALR